MFIHERFVLIRCLAGVLFICTTGQAATSSDMPPHGLAGIEERIRHAQYNVRQTPANAPDTGGALYEASNRAHGLRVYFMRAGVRVLRRPANAQSRKLDMRLAGYGYGDNVREATEAELVSSGNRMEYLRPGLTEWYVNDPRGLEQGFTIAAPPVHGPGNSDATSATLFQILLDMHGDCRAALSDGDIIFALSDDADSVHYGGLHAYDAAGRALSTRLTVDSPGEPDPAGTATGAVGGKRIRIAVEVAGTTYPVTIDPLLTSPQWDVSGPESTSAFGSALAAAGDVNGDGYADVIAGASHFGDGESNEGIVYVYHGSPSGLSATTNWSFQGDQQDAHLGQAVCTAGDVNGDGYADVIVGAPDYDNGQQNEGAVFVFYGSSTGLSAAADWTMEGNQEDAHFGYSVATAGDVNGDGYSDVIVGAPDYDHGENNEGRVFVYYGSAAGLSADADWTAESDQDNADFGHSVAAAGDVNADGYGDVIVGAYNYESPGQNGEGWAFVYHGSPAGLGTNTQWTAEGNDITAQFGWSVATAGDVNGDGYSDVIVGARLYDGVPMGAEGAAFVYHGSRSGLSGSHRWRVVYDCSGARFGHAVSTAGDVDGDGYADIVVSAPESDHGGSECGRALLYHGSPAGLVTGAQWWVDGPKNFANLGTSVATAGDVDGDGYGDVIVGISGYFISEARAYHGSPAGLITSAQWTVQSDRADTWYGFSVADAGDVNGDGYADIIVGARAYDNGQTNEGAAFLYYGSASGPSTTAQWMVESDDAHASLGQSVDGAGDVNGDGYDDVIVGAPIFDNGEGSEGAAFVFHGSATGLSATADWAAYGYQAAASFGNSVAGAGDVNGDGYADVIVGQSGYDGDQDSEGRALVYYGSPSGLSDTADWTAEGNSVHAYFGGSVSTAGDVDGDGCSDVIVGAYCYSNGQQEEGGAFVFHGSPSGLSGTPDWSAESDTGWAHFGNAVASAGDVNGDGYADVVVGAMTHPQGVGIPGRAYVFLGSPDGLSTAAQWEAEGEYDDHDFGRSVGTAGDVNGDGYADIIVGAPYPFWEVGDFPPGAAFIYPGSADGVSSTVCWRVEGSQTNAHFGFSVASGGDVNGDGYSDVIVGVPEYSEGEQSEGQARLYYGAAFGISLVPPWEPAVDWSLTPTQHHAHFGISVASAGDVNGDGYGDLIVGAPYAHNGEQNEGQAFVYHGSASGLSDTTNWTAEGDEPELKFGGCVDTAGDVNGDGYDDVVVGLRYYDNDQTNEGAALVYHGSADGLSPTTNWMFESDKPYAQFGRSVSTAGDVNGDGYDDLIVGAHSYIFENINGRAYAFYGSSTGLSVTAEWIGEDPDINSIGWSVSEAGDVNGDGYDDVIVGAPSHHNGETWVGAALVYHGSSNGLSSVTNWIAEGDQEDCNFGYAVCGAGDVNGDGYSDVIVGAPFYDIGQTNEGRAYVFLGSASGLESAAAWTQEINEVRADFGFSVGSAGDLNGDGYGDVIVGAPYGATAPERHERAFIYLGSASGLGNTPAWTLHEGQHINYFGHRVGTAGDVNGDGFSDLVVGAYFYGSYAEGAVFMQYGSSRHWVALRPRQRRSNNSAPIANLGLAHVTGKMRLAATARTPFGRGKVKLECEVLPLGTAFNGSNTLNSATWYDTGTDGTNMSVLVSDLDADTAYHWRLRLRYHPASTPFQQHSRWITVPWNGWTEQDFRTPAGIGGGPDGTLFKFK